MQNIGFDQEKLKTLTNITILNVTKSIVSYNILKVTHDEEAIQLLINIRHTVMGTETKSPIQNMPHYTILVFCLKMLEIPNTRQRRPYRTFSNNTM